MRWLVVGPWVVLLLAAMPLASAAPLNLPGAVVGTVTSCSYSIVVCSFNFSSTLGYGFARTTIFPSSQITFRLPGEALNTTGMPISYATSKTNTSIERVVGTFLGTDANSGKVVNGHTDTNFTVVTHCFKGCYTTYTLRNGTIAATPTKFFGTTTSVSCAPATTHPGHRTSCTISVSTWNATNYPTGRLHLTDGRLGSLTNKGYCSLSSGSCALNFTPYDNTCGGVTLSATYPGTPLYYRSSGDTVVDVIVAGGC